jgi:hypothetical protein
VATVKEALKSPGVEDFVKSFREDSKVLIVRKGGKQVGRFLKVASFAIGGRKWSIWLPEARDGQGWRRVAGELSKMVVFLESTTGSIGGVVVSSDGKNMQLSSDGYPLGDRPEKGEVVSSYADVVRGMVGSSIKISATSRPMAKMSKLDLLPMSLFRVEEDSRVAVNCFDLEEKKLGLMEKSSTIRSHGGSKSRKMKLVNPRFWKNLLGLLRSDLDQVASTMAQFIGRNVP